MKIPALWKTWKNQREAELVSEGYAIGIARQRAFIETKRRMMVARERGIAEALAAELVSVKSRLGEDRWFLRGTLGRR